MYEVGIDVRYENWRIDPIVQIQNLARQAYPRGPGCDVIESRPDPPLDPRAQRNIDAVHVAHRLH